MFQSVVAGESRQPGTGTAAGWYASADPMLEDGEKVMVVEVVVVGL